MRIEASFSRLCCRCRPRRSCRRAAATGAAAAGAAARWGGAGNHARARRHGTRTHRRARAACRTALNEHRASLDRDPRGDLVVRAEVMAIDITDEALASAIKARFSRVAHAGIRGSRCEDHGVADTGGMAPLADSSAFASSIPKARTTTTTSISIAARSHHRDREAGRTAHPRRQASGHRVGLIDGGVEAKHEAFARHT